MVVSVYLCVYMTTMQSITQSAVQERLVMEEELKKALDRCKELEQSSVPMVYTRVLQTTGDESGTVTCTDYGLHYALHLCTSN